jgi:predicted nuclease of restriction endonuclease-like RecB superfamily
MRVLNNAEFSKEYKKITGQQDFMKEVRGLAIGNAIAIPSDNKANGLRIRHSVVNDAYLMREKGENRKYQTIVKEDEVWVRRVE